MLRLGDEWPRDGSRRKLGLVSMPCDSAAAGLVALGGVISDLKDPAATDIHYHRAQLLDFARQYLTFCRNCEYRCKPDIRGCGFDREASGIVKHFQAHNNISNDAHKTKHKQPRSRKYIVSRRTDFEAGQLAFERDGVVVWPSSNHVAEWQIDGLPQIKSAVASAILPKSYYEGFFKSGQIVERNLTETYSRSCLAGRATGRSATLEAFQKLRFRTEKSEVFTLVDALPIHGWTDWAVSRLVFFNTRTCETDRPMQIPRFVVADGISAFLAVRGRHEFSNSDIVGIINRTSDTDRLEDFGAVLAELIQWYEPDEDSMAGLPEVPKGMAIVILRSKS